MAVIRTEVGVAACSWLGRVGDPDGPCGFQLSPEVVHGGGQRAHHLMCGLELLVGEGPQGGSVGGTDVTEERAGNIKAMRLVPQDRLASVDEVPLFPKRPGRADP